ncbi:MAG: P-II family nitrogen regulator [Lachnospiraceae bacterium]|nr:P-II family nitrogen regulator [Lachnospiraceae bacterium]
MVLYFVVALLGRKNVEQFQQICDESGILLSFTMIGRGTASPDMLTIYKREDSEKFVISALADGPTSKKLFKAAREKMYMDIPGNGILMSIPVKSITGGNTLAYFTNEAPVDGGLPKMKFENELIVMITNKGYVQEVMDTAREAGATGGTSVHVKGTGAKFAKKFLGVSLAEEREMILIISSADKKKDIMHAVAEKNGQGTGADAISFSLPLSYLTGIRRKVVDIEVEAELREKMEAETQESKDAGNETVRQD